MKVSNKPKGEMNMGNTKMENLKKTNAKYLARDFKEFVDQKPGFDRRDYSDSASYQSDYRAYKQPADYNRSLYEGGIEEIFSALTEEELAHRVFNDRLYVNEEGKLEYITGQYFPTEYQWAAKNTYEKALRIYKLKEEGDFR